MTLLSKKPTYEKCQINGLHIDELNVVQNKLINCVTDFDQILGHSGEIQKIRELFLFKRELSEIYCPVPKFNTIAKQTKLILLAKDDAHKNLIKKDLFPESKVNTTDFEVYTKDFYFDQYEALQNKDLSHYYNLPKKSLEKLDTWIQKNNEPYHQNESRVPVEKAIPVVKDKLSFTLPKEYEDLVSGKRRLRGPPGSGKTSVLCRLAINSLTEEKHVLLTCYNITMVNYLHSLLYPYIPARGQLTLTNYHNFIRRMFIMAGKYSEYAKIFQKSYGNMADKEIVKTMQEILADKNFIHPEFNSILIDEGQDFEGDWWNLLRKFSINEPYTQEYDKTKPKAHFLIAYDYGQNIYDRQEWLESNSTEFGFKGSIADTSKKDEDGIIKVSYRMPTKVAQLATIFAQSFFDANQTYDLPRSETMNDDSETYWRDVNNYNEAIDEIKEFMGNELVDLNSNCITTIAVDTKNSGKGLYEVLKLHTKRKINHLYHSGEDDKLAKLGFSPVERELNTFKFKPTSDLLMSTFHSFKGWESQSLILVVTNLSQAKDLRSLYTMFTRVKKALNPDEKSRLLIINMSPTNVYIGNQSSFREKISGIVTE